MFTETLPLSRELPPTCQQMYPHQGHFSKRSETKTQFLTFAKIDLVVIAYEYESLILHGA